MPARSDRACPNTPLRAVAAAARPLNPPLRPTPPLAPPPCPPPPPPPPPPPWPPAPAPAELPPPELPPPVAAQMGAAKITATAKITTLLNMARTPVIHLTSCLLAPVSRVNQPMAVICCRAKSGEINVVLAVFPAYLINRPRVVNVSYWRQREALR